MLLIITNGIFSALLFFLVSFPPLYINRSFSHEKNTLPPCIDELCSDTTISSRVKERLYFLVIIPFCVTANCIFLYFSYYRYIRFIQFRVELNILSLYNYRYEVQNKLNMLDSHQLGIRRSSILNKKSLRGKTSSLVQQRKPNTVQHGGTELNASNTSRGTNSTSSFDWRARAEFIRYTRPKNLKKDAYVLRVIFHEIRELYIQVENFFFTPAMIAEKNFITIRDRLANAAGSVPAVNLKPTKASAELITGEYYNSKRTPVLLFGASVRKQLQQQQQKHDTREHLPFSARPMDTNAPVALSPGSDLDNFHPTVLRTTEVGVNVRPSHFMNSPSEGQLTCESDRFGALESSSVTWNYEK